VDLNAFELLYELTSELTKGNFPDMDDDLVDTDALLDTWEDIISDIEDVLNSEINNTNGTMDDYKDLISDWIDNPESLLEDLDINGSFTEQVSAINDVLDHLKSTLIDDKDESPESMDESSESMDESSESMEESDETALGTKEDSMEWWVWVLVAVAACCLICAILGFTVYQKDKKLSGHAIDIENETQAQVEVPAGKSETMAGGKSEL